MILNTDAINELHHGNYRCAYCKKSLKGYSTRDLVALKKSGHWKYYHMPCYEKIKDPVVHSHGKSTRLRNAVKGRQLLYSRNRKTRRFK